MKQGSISTWPTSGGLQSITNQGPTPGKAGMKHLSHPQAGDADATVTIKTSSHVAKTPSPKKVTIKIEPASGKENVTAVRTSPAAA